MQYIYIKLLSSHRKHELNILFQSIVYYNLIMNFKSINLTQNALFTGTLKYHCYIYLHQDNLLMVQEHH